MNKVILMGRLTRDPDVRYSGNSQDAMCIGRFTVAVDRKTKKNEADFIGCVAFGKQAEFCEKYLHQGTKIATTGRIQTGSYTNKDGQKVYTTDVIVEEIEFAESKNTNEANSRSNTGKGSEPAEAQQPMNEGFMSIPDGAEEEGLPFN